MLFTILTQKCIKMATFNERQFLDTVKRMNEISPALVSEHCAKNLLRETSLHCGYNKTQVFQYFNAICNGYVEDFSCVEFDVEGWKYILKYYIKNDMHPEGFSSFRKLLSKRKVTKEMCESHFDHVLSPILDISLLKTEMTIDSIEGWRWLLQTIINMAEGKETKITSIEGLLAFKKKGKETNKTIGDLRDDNINANVKIFKKDSYCRKKSNHPGKVNKKIRSRGINTPILQYSKEGTFLKSFNSIKEAVKSNAKFKVATILHCLYGYGKSAYGFRWVYRKRETAHPEISQPSKKETSFITEQKNKLHKRSLQSYSLVAYHLDKNKEIISSREIGKYATQKDACIKLDIKKCSLSNYLRGQRKSIRCKINGNKCLIGFMRIPI